MVTISQSPPPSVHGSFPFLWTATQRQPQPLHSGLPSTCIVRLSPPHFPISLRKFSAVKHVVVIAPDSLHPDYADALKLFVDEFLQPPIPVISQSQLPRWKTDDGSYRMKLIKAHALSLVQFDKVRVLHDCSCRTLLFARMTHHFRSLLWMWHWWQLLLLAILCFSLRHPLQAAP